MSFKEVKKLRESGDLQGAYELATSDLEQNPSDVWSKRALAWVIYYYLKENSSKANFDVCIKYLEEIIDLELEDKEEMFFSSITFQIGKLIFDLCKDQNVPLEKINTIFELVKKLAIPKKTEAYSFLFKAFHKAYKDSTKYISFCDWWDFNNFINQDFQKQDINGKSVISVVEQAYNSFSKSLLKGTPIGITIGNIPVNSIDSTIDKKKIKDFFPALDKIISNYKDFQYPIYYKVKLMHAIGEKSKAIESFIPFAKKKKNDFWVWELLADCFEDHSEEKIACLCKAVTLNSKEDFLIKVRTKLAELLIKKSMFTEAKFEIEKSSKVKLEKGWPISNQIKEWQHSQWYTNAPNINSNFSLYNNSIKTAEEILYSNLPEHIIVIEFVNKNKHIVNFIKNKTVNGFFNYKNIIKNPKIGEIYSVRMESKKNDRFYTIFSCSKQNNTITNETLKEFDGEIKLIEGSGIGFIYDVFISKNLIQENNITQNQAIGGKAILSFNKKKNNWGWKAINIYDKNK